MTGKQFIEFARKLLAHYEDDPAEMRSIVSRFYYGMFHLAKKHLEELGFHVVRTEHAHQFVQTRLQNANEENAYLLGDLLVQLHERRKQADYKLDNQRFESARFGEEAVERVNLAITAFENCCQEPARTKIKSGISSYHRKINYAT